MSFPTGERTPSANVTATSRHRERTPIDRVTVGGRTVYVKREDLYGGSPAPPLGKMRGMRDFVAARYSDGFRVFGCWDTRVSRLGHALAACCLEYPDVRCIVSYPTKKGADVPEPIERARMLGAEVYPVKGGRITISFAQARRYVESAGGTMLPFGFECAEAVDGVRREAVRIPRKYLEGGSLVVCCGSGVTLAGILSGVCVLPATIIGISSGRSATAIRACLARRASILPEGLKIQDAEVPYSVALTYPCPFPSHPNYDLKAWRFLVEHLADLADPVLFWNVGA
jgi:hypothetical protein